MPLWSGPLLTPLLYIARPIPGTLIDVPPTRRIMTVMAPLLRLEQDVSEAVPRERSILTLTLTLTLIGGGAMGEIYAPVHGPKLRSTMTTGAWDAFG